MNGMVNEFQADPYSEYFIGRYHNDINKDRSKDRNGILKDDAVIHIDVAYKKKTVQVHLSFSEEKNDKNVQLFYDGLKKIYLEKNEFGAMHP